MGEMKNECRILVCKAEKKSSVGRLGLRSENEIQMNIKGIGYEVLR